VSEFRAHVIGFKVHGFMSSTPGSGFRVWSFRFRVKGLGFRV